jgi:hypothetical protein
MQPVVPDFSFYRIVHGSVRQCGVKIKSEADGVSYILLFFW